MQAQSLLRFITIKGTKQNCKGKRHIMCSVKETRHKFPRVCSQWSYTGYTQFPQQGVVTTHVKCALPEKFSKDSVPRFSLGAHHIGTFCWAHINIPDYQKVDVSINPIIYINSLGIVCHFYQEIVAILLKCMFPDASQGTTLERGLLRVTVSGLLC